MTLLAIIGWILCAILGFLLFRASKRLLQFDDALGTVTDVLGGYADDLRKMSSGGVLVDHPEVSRFHNRNLQALRDVFAAVEQIKEVRPPEEPRRPLPMPDVE